MSKAILQFPGWGGRIDLVKNVGITCFPPGRKLKLYSYLSSNVKVNPKYVTNLNMK